MHAELLRERGTRNYRLQDIQSSSGSLTLSGTTGLARYARLVSRDPRAGPQAADKSILDVATVNVAARALDAL
jgi:hypothetical protein